jgi:CrcB protein
VSHVHEAALVVGVALAGALGAPARYMVERVTHTRWPSRWPWGTFVVNVSGSLALGVVVGLALAQGLDPDVRTIAGTGFLGAYTTFSTYAYETVRVGGDRPPRHGLAVAYAFGSVVASVLVAAIGLVLTRAW